MKEEREEAKEEKGKLPRSAFYLIKKSRFSTAGQNLKKHEAERVDAGQPEAARMRKHPWASLLFYGLSVGSEYLHALANTHRVLPFHDIIAPRFYRVLYRVRGNFKIIIISGTLVLESAQQTNKQTKNQKYPEPKILSWCSQNVWLCYLRRNGS